MIDGNSLATMPIFPWKRVELNDDQPAREKRLEAEGEGISKSADQGHRSLSKTRIGLIAVVTLVIAGLVATTIYYGIYASRERPKKPLMPCGNSTTEALAAGCTFDQLTWTWYPPHCPHCTNDWFINAEPSRPWTYWDIKVNGTAHYATDADFYQLLDSGVKLYGERREHLTHCVYMFLAAVQILREGGQYSEKLAPGPHYIHCANMVLNTMRRDPNWFQVNTQIPAPYYDEVCRER